MGQREWRMQRRDAPENRIIIRTGTGLCEGGVISRHSWSRRAAERATRRHQTIRLVYATCQGNLIGTGSHVNGNPAGINDGGRSDGRCKIRNGKENEYIGRR